MTRENGRPGLGLALRLARRELRGGLQGFRIFLACLMLGVAAIAGVGSVSEAVLAGLRAEGRNLLGGDLDPRLAHRKTTPEEFAWISNQADVSVVTHMRAMARATGGNGQRSLVELRAVDGNYPLYGEVELTPAQPLQQALAYDGEAWGAAAARNLLARLDLEPGGRVKVGDALYEIRAVLEREPDRTTQALILGPSFVVSSASLGDSGLDFRGAALAAAALARASYIGCRTCRS